MKEPVAAAAVVVVDDDVVAAAVADDVVVVALDYYWLHEWCCYGCHYFGWVVFCAFHHDHCHLR